MLLYHEGGLYGNIQLRLLPNHILFAMYDNKKPNTVINNPSGEEIGYKIRTLIDNSGLTINEVAEISGVPYSTVSKIYSGKTRDPRYVSLRGIVLACNGSFDELINMKVDMDGNDISSLLSDDDSTPPSCEAASDEVHTGSHAIVDLKDIAKRLDNMTVHYGYSIMHLRQSQGWYRSCILFLCAIIIILVAYIIIRDVLSLV